MEIAITLGIKDLVVFVESLLVIREVRKLVRNYKSPSNKMHHIFNSLISDFNAINFIHILQSNNQSVNQMANKGAQLDSGYMICTGNIPERCWVPWYRTIFVYQTLKNPNPLSLKDFRIAAIFFLICSVFVFSFLENL